MSLEIPGYIIEEIRFLVRGGTAANLAAVNEIPFPRELIVETDTLKMKLGDGITHYNDLLYIATGGGGDPVEFRVDSGYVQWSNDGGATWNNLLPVSDLVGPQGPPGTAGTPGTDGADGDSAYQVAVNNGFVGTEEEWLESLQGADGPEGPQGPPGADAVGAATRATITLPDGTGTASVGKLALLVAIESDVEARIRLYCDAASRSADASRPSNVAPPQGSGLLLEFKAVSILLGAPLTPGVVAYNLDDPVAGVIYYNIEAAGSASVDLTYLKLEN